MKRLICILLTAALVLTLAGCGCAKVEVAEEEAVDWQTAYDLGVRYLSEGNYEEAIIAFKVAIEIDPKQENSYMKCAEAYTLQGDNDSALEVLEQGYRETQSEQLLQEKNRIEGSLQETTTVTEQPAEPLAYTVERVERTDRSVQNESGETVLRMYYDLVTVEGDSAAAERINETLRSEYDSFFTSNEMITEFIFAFTNGGADYLIENSPEATAERPFFDMVDAVVTYNDGKYFSVKLKLDWHVTAIPYGYCGLVFDAETGEQVRIDELVPDSLTQFADIIWDFYSEGGLFGSFDDLYSQLSYDNFSYCISESGEITLLTDGYSLSFANIYVREIPTGMYIEQATQNIATEEEFVQAILGQWGRYDDEQDATFFVYFREDGTAAIAIGYGTAGCFAGGGSGTWKLESFSGDGKGSVYIEILWKSDDGGTQNWDKGTIEITADGISPRLNSVDEGIPLVTGRYSSDPWYYVE